MKTPKGWRLIVVDEQPYLWTVRAKKIECARALRVHVRRAEVVDDVVVSHTYVGAMETTIAGPSHCGGPQCRQLDPPRAITPAEVAAWIRGEATTR